MSGYERENGNVLRHCLNTASDGAAVTWACRSLKLWMCDCRLWIDEWSVRASDQSRTNAVFVVMACLQHEWSRTGNNSVQRHEWLNMLKLSIWRRCAPGYAANEGWWALERCARNAINRIWHKIWHGWLRQGRLSITQMAGQWVQEVIRDIRGSQKWKSRSRFQILVRATLLLSFFSFFGLVSPGINLHAKLEICIFSCSRDIRGSHNLKSRSRDLGRAPFWPIFHFFF